MHRRISALFILSAGLLGGAYAGAIHYRTGDTVAAVAPAQVARAAKADRFPATALMARVERRGKADRFTSPRKVRLASVARSAKTDRLATDLPVVAVARTSKRDPVRTTLAAVVRPAPRAPEPAVARTPEPLNIIPAAARIRTALVSDAAPVRISKAELRWLEPGYLK